MNKMIRNTASVLCVILVLFCLCVSSGIVVDEYTISKTGVFPTRIVHLTDLHNSTFDTGNIGLITAVNREKPDLIFISGDMLNRDDPSTDIVVSLVSELSKIAPVYYGYGNHERAWEENNGQLLRGVLEDAGAVVLDNEYVDVTVNGNPIRIGGYMGYYRQPGMMTTVPDQREAECRFFDAYEDTERLKLLIDHIPTSWSDWGYLDKYPVDVVFSGHYHGGMIRIPFLDRGLYAPYIGWFPPVTKGIVTGEKGSCVLSAGLGSEHSVPRVFNPPEIVVVDLVPSER